MRLWTALAWIILTSAASASPALAQRFPFERSFDVTGPAALDVSTIRGKIEVTTGEPGRIVVVGTATVRVDWNVPANAADLARGVAQNPPIEREGQTFRLRSPSDAATLRAVTVSYQVRVPPDTAVQTVSESGATSVRGVTGAVSVRTQSAAIDVAEIGGATTVTTGSGAVLANRIAGALTVSTSSSRFTGSAIAGSVRVRTSSGEVEIAFAGDGDVDVETGSSAIRLQGVRGAVVVATRSGRTSLHGLPRRDWAVSSGSGGIDIITESSVPLTLDATTGAGSVKVIGEPVQGSVTKRKVDGSIAGGGPLLKLLSRSGSIVLRLGAGPHHR